MKPSSQNILAGIRVMIEAAQTFLYSEAKIPWIQFRLDTGGSPGLYTKVLAKDWKNIELTADSTLSSYLDPKESWYEVVQTLLHEGKAGLWIDRVYSYEFLATAEWMPTLIIVPKKK